MEEFDDYPDDDPDDSDALTVWADELAAAVAIFDVEVLEAGQEG